MRTIAIFDEQEIKNKEFLKEILLESIQNEDNFKKSSQEIKKMIFNEIKKVWIDDYKEIVQDIEKMILYLESPEFENDFKLENKYKDY